MIVTRRCVVRRERDTLSMDDITRVRGLAEAENPVAMWQILADNLPQLAWIAGPDGSFHWFNRAWHDFAGNSASGPTQSIWNLVDPDREESARDRWYASTASGTAWEDVLPLRGATGEYGYFLSRANPVRDGDGRVTAWVGTHTDVTALRGAQRRDRFLIKLDNVLRSLGDAASVKQAALGLLGAELQASRVLYSTPNGRRHEFAVADEFLADGVPSIAGTHRLPAAVFETYAKGEPVVVEDYHDDALLGPARDDPAIAALAVRAVLDVPLVLDGELRGVLSIHDIAPRRWTAEELDLASATAHRTWQAVERGRAESEARANAEEITAIYESAPVGLTVLDSDLRYVRINERLAEMNGLPAAEHIGRSVREVVPDLAEKVEAVLREVLEGREVWGLEISGSTAADPGVVRTWRENWLPLRRLDGAITGVAISAEDVTREKVSERLLRDSEERFRFTLEAANGIGTWDWDVAKDVVFTSAPFGRMYGIDPERGAAGLPVRDYLEAIHPDDRASVGELIAEAVAFGGDYHAEYRILSTDGSVHWIIARGRCLKDDEGKAVRFPGVTFDITDRRRTEEQLREASAHLNAILDNTSMAVFLLDEEQRCTFANAAAERLTGYSAADLLGRPLQGVVHKLLPDGTPYRPEESLFCRAFTERTQTSGEKLFVAPDGSFYPIAFTASPLLDADGRPLGTVVEARDIAEERAQNAALKASEERYRALFESMEQGFCVIEVLFDGEQAVDHRFIELNPAFTQQSGLPAQVLGRSIREAVPNLEESWFGRYGDIARNGQSERFVDHAEALGRWFEVYAFRIGNPADRHVAVLFTDVTDRVEHEKQLQLRLNAIPQMVWSTLPDGLHDFYNDRWYEFTGVPHGSTDGKGWNGMFHPDDQQAALKRWHSSLVTGEPYEIEYRLRHHSGDYRWVLGRALPIRDQDGTVVRWMGTCTDIHDAVEARRALTESEARMRAVIEAAPVGLVFADATGRITGGNNWVEQIVGHPVLPSKDVASYSEWVGFHEDGRPVQGHEYPLGRVLSENLPSAELLTHYRRGDGTMTWVWFSAAPVRDLNGKVIGGVVASINVDREKRLTESLEREVEKVVAEREAAQEALRQSQKLEAMGQLTGGVAHDFNNLLTPIIGSLDLLQRKQVGDDRTQRLIDGALQSAERAKTLVQRLLAFARRQPLQPTAVDVGRIVTDMADLVASTSGPRVRVDVEVEPELPPARADSNQLEMALLNLSVNARDAMPDGGTLSIGLRQVDAAPADLPELGGRPHVMLSVADSGVGMDEETLARCIEPFFSTKGIGKGTGLGLSMVHGLAAQLGGALRIDSREGVGTVIELWLPVSTDEVQPGADRPSNRADGQGLVLLVDDEDLVRDSTASMLGGLGYEVVEAASAEAALGLVKNGLRPDLLVSDHLMPGLSGTDLAVRLRARMPGLPVLIVSGYAGVDGLAPAFPRLTKPFRQADLAASVSALRGEPAVSAPASGA